MENTNSLSDTNHPAAPDPVEKPKGLTLKSFDPGNAGHLEAYLGFIRGDGWPEGFWGEEFWRVTGENLGYQQLAVDVSTRVAAHLAKEKVGEIPA